MVTLCPWVPFDACISMALITFSTLCSMPSLWAPRAPSLLIFSMRPAIIGFNRNRDGGWPVRPRRALASGHIILAGSKSLRPRCSSFPFVLLRVSVCAGVSIEHILREVYGGWLLRHAHANGASLFFLAVYLHLFRGLALGHAWRVFGVLCVYSGIAAYPHILSRQH